VRRASLIRVVAYDIRIHSYIFTIHWRSYHFVASASVATVHSKSKSNARLDYCSYTILHSDYSTAVMGPKRTSNFRNRKNGAAQSTISPAADSYSSDGRGSSTSTSTSNTSSISRRRGKRQFTGSTASLIVIVVVVVVVSMAIGIGRDRVMNRLHQVPFDEGTSQNVTVPRGQQQQQQRVQRANRQHDRSLETTASFDNIIVDNGKVSRPNRPRRFWKNAKTSLIEGLRASCPISGHFAVNNNKAVTATSAVPVVQTSSSVAPTTAATRLESPTTTGPDLSAEYPSAFSVNPHLTASQRILIQTMSRAVYERIPDIHQLAGQVPWGGPNSGSAATAAWWNPSLEHAHHYKHASLDTMDGGYLLHSHLQIMKWPADLKIRFPFRLCKDGCPAEVSIDHTLEWRSKFQPWMATPSMMTENRDGWVYARGFSPPARQDPHYGRHALVWTRPGIHGTVDPLMFFRCILHSVDRAVGLSLQDSGGRVGQFNVLVDGAGFEWTKAPGVKFIKQAVGMLQDHFPNRLGTVFMVNISRTGELLLSLVKPLLTKDVRDKIKILSKDPEKRRAQLETLVEREYIPDWLDGSDTYRFDADSYYFKHQRWSDDQGREFMTTMPYHAI